MQILRVLNNNVVLARDDATGGEVVVTGRGVAFGAKRGDVVDPGKVQRVFVPVDGRDPDHVGEMVAGLPAEGVEKVAGALEAVGVAPSVTLVTAVTDHVLAALERAGGGAMVYPLRAEVVHLYPDEFARAGRLLVEINRRFAVSLPESEVTALALHLVNAGFHTGDLAHTYRMTGLIQQMLEVMEAELGVRPEPHSVNIARFITHIRYLFVRIEQGKQLCRGNSPLLAQLQGVHPREFACARKLASIVELRFDTTVSEDEIAYLGLHIARLCTYDEM